MTENKAPTPLAQHDYEAIEDAVMETQRGRWFLTEYARRNRNADTTVLLKAIKKLERSIEHPAQDLQQEQVRFDLMEMASEIARTRMDIAAIAPKHGEESQLNSVASELGSVVTATEEATYKILTAAESVQEVVWDLRDRGTNEDDCARLEQYATDVFSACDFQDLTGQRIAKVVHVLGYIEERLNSMIEIWGDDNLIEQTQTPDDLEITDSYLQSHIAITQDTVDDLMFDSNGNPTDATALQLPAPLPVDADDTVSVSGAVRLPDDEDLIAVDQAATDIDADAEEISNEIKKCEDGGHEFNASGGSGNDVKPVGVSRETALLSAAASDHEVMDDPTVADIDGLSQDDKTALFT